MAPELIRKEGHSFALDWWTVGVLTYELVVGRSPFLSKNPRKIHSNIWKSKKSLFLNSIYRWYSMARSW